jgi:hypothetical protein
MRFIRQEEIITTICNKEIEDNKNIAFVLERLKEEGVYFALTIKKMFSSDYRDRTIAYEKVKVKNVNAETDKVDFIVYKGSSLIKLTNMDFEDINEIFALTKKTNLLDSSQNKGFFDYIDIEE